MIGVTDITPHGQAQQLATEMIFQAGPGNLLAVKQVFGADESNHRVHQKRLEFAGHGVRPGFTGLLVHTVMGISGQRTALAGLEIHHIVAHGASVQRERRIPGLGQSCQIKSEAAVSRLGTADGLEYQIHRRLLFDGFQGVGNMGQDAGLGRNLVLSDHLIHHLQQPDTLGHAVSRGIDPDNGIATAVKQSIQDAGRYTGHVVRWMVGLESCGHSPG